MEAEHEGTTPQVISVATAEELSKLWWIRYELTVGEKFEHPTRGTGTIVKLDFKTSRVHVEFAGREVHRYHEHSWKKFNKESRAARRAKRIRKVSEFYFHFMIVYMTEYLTNLMICINDDYYSEGSLIPSWNSKVI